MCLVRKAGGGGNFLYGRTFRQHVLRLLHAHLHMPEVRRDAGGALKAWLNDDCDWPVSPASSLSRIVGRSAALCAG